MILFLFFAQVKYKIKGHQKRVTGLAFSTVLNVLVSSGADSQVCFIKVGYDLCAMLLCVCVGSDVLEF